MTTDDAFADSLAAGLKPVTRRTPARDWTAFALLAAAELIAYAGLRGMRPDMPMAMGLMAFWWKGLSLLVLAVIGVATTITALAPERSARRGLRGLGIAAAVAVALGWIVDASRAGPADLIARLDWREGLSCVGAVVILAAPALGALVVLMRRGAPTDPRRTATAAGAAAAAWGGAVFTLRCPHDDPLYIAVWFAVAILAIMAFARVTVPRLTRW